MAKSKSSRRWLQEHNSDYYTNYAKRYGLRARSACKLMEMHDKYKIFKPGMKIVDLGAAPGGWSQVAYSCAKTDAHIVGVDILPIEPIEGVTFITGDIAEQNVYNRLLTEFGSKVDVVLSDMAPNLSGQAIVDQMRHIALVEIANDLVSDILIRGGTFLVKIFQGVGFDSVLLMLRKNFSKVHCVKPKASRARSKELYLLAQGYCLGKTA